MPNFAKICQSVVVISRFLWFCCQCTGSQKNRQNSDWQLFIEHTPKCWTVSHLAKTTSWLLRSTVVYLIDLSTGGNYTLNIQTKQPFLRPTLQSVQCVGLLQWCTVFKAVNVLVHLCVICKRISTVSQLKWRQNSNLYKYNITEHKHVGGPTILIALITIYLTPTV